MDSVYDAMPIDVAPFTILYFAPISSCRYAPPIYDATLLPPSIPCLLEECCATAVRFLDSFAHNVPAGVDDDNDEEDLVQRQVQLAVGCR